MKEIKNRRCKNHIERSEPDHSVPNFECDSNEIFRRHFERNFEPLFFEQQDKTHEDRIQANTPEEINLAQDESDWTGFSEDETTTKVINHTEILSYGTPMNKTEMKYFMSSKPPKCPNSNPSTSNVAIEAEDTSEAMNLKNDLALQRLLSESHLLDSTQDLQLSGRNRHKVTDLRVQALGSNNSLLIQSKMPMAHRRGIIAKKNQRELKRQIDAKNNGIILEKSILKSKKSECRGRDIGLGVPIVGRFNHGTLNLSRKDVQVIEGRMNNHSRRKGKTMKQPLKTRRSKA